MNRRQILAGAILTGGWGAAVWIAGGARAGWASEPPVAAPGPDGFIELRAGDATLALAASPTPGAGYGGASPGPLIHLRPGEPLAVRLVNGLAEPTTLAFPGLRPPNAFAGVADLTEAPLAPGARRDIRFVPPDSGFNVYGPDLRGFGAGQSARGLCGPVIVEEAEAPKVDLDLVALISDGPHDAAGAPARPGDSADLLTVNGAPAPFVIAVAPGGRVRLRLANVATARILPLGVEGAKTAIVAIDGQPSAPFAPLRDLVPIGPRARFELVFDMPYFDLPREAGARVRFLLRGDEPAKPDRPLLIFEARGEAVAARAPFVGLAANPRLPAEIALERAQRVELTLSGGGDAPFAVNGASISGWTPKPLFTAPRGAPVTLAFANATPFPQAMQLGGHVARFLHALDDGWEPYWRDTFLIAPGKTVHAAFVADNPGKWPIQSASPDRRDAGLAAWFQVS